MKRVCFFRRLINSYLVRRQELQFHFHRLLSRIHATSVDDPLFKCRFTAGEPHSSKFPSWFRARTRSSGLGIKGSIEIADAESRPKHIELLVDNQVIRKEKLSFSGNSANFSFPIKRSAVLHFPQNCELQIRTTKGDIIPWKGTDRLRLRNPQGTGLIHELLSKRGQLDKKGYIPMSAEEVTQRQNSYLELYSKVRKTFDEKLNRPLFIIYGTLLGLYRDGDFIPGDDDFDVGYVSKETDPVSVKKEVEEIVFALLHAGFSVEFNQRGKPFRVKELEGPPQVHLDVRPIWYQDGHVWAHKQACLRLDLQGFEDVLEKRMRGTSVYIPADTEGFLRAYYGENWRTPDPSFSNSNMTVSEHVKSNLKQNCFTPFELWRLRKKAAKERKNNPQMGELIPLGLLTIYPLSDEEQISDD